MPDTTKPLNSLADLCRQLSQVIKTEPIEQMESQLAAQQAQNEDNLRWLDEAMALLNEVSRIDDEQQAAQIIAKVERFISKAHSVDYHEDKYSATISAPGHKSAVLEGIAIPGCPEFAQSENPKKN